VINGDEISEIQRTFNGVTSKAIYRQSVNLITKGDLNSTSRTTELVNPIACGDIFT
jgi:hypothetical protein